MSCNVLALWPVLPHVKFFVKCLSAEVSFPVCLAQNRCAKMRVRPMLPGRTSTQLLLTEV